MKLNIKHLRLIATALFVIAFATFGIVGQDAKDPNQNGLGPKKAGVKRVGVLLPNVTLKNAGDRVDPADAVRNTFEALLSSSSIELVPLDARLSALAYREAIEKQCDYVLKITLTQSENKKGGFLDRMVDRAADSAIYETTSKIPRTGNVAGNVGRETVVGAGQQVSEVEFTIKKGDQLALEYVLSTPKVKSVKENNLKAKAEKDNDDVLLPLIERAANEIAEFLLR